MDPKKPVSERIADQAFDNETFQMSWQIHMRAFGPLLAPAFVDNTPARVHLCNALNRISRRDIRGGMELVDKLTAAVRCDADRAVLAFARALACEMLGDSEGAVPYYAETVQYNDAFYLPHVKLARAAHVDADFDGAAEHYRAAIRCLLRGAANEQIRTQIAALRTNLASALTMMHDYEAAASELATAKAELPEQPGREATEAILAAAMGDDARVEALLTALAVSIPQAAEETRRMTAEILAGKHPHFASVETDPAALDAFWRWCASREAAVQDLQSAGDTDGLSDLLGERLAVLSPYLRRPVKIAVTPTDADGWIVTLGDYHMVALRTLYEALLHARPDGLLPSLTFSIGH